MRYAFTPECRHHGPLAALAVSGFPNMTRSRRPVPAKRPRAHENRIEKSFTFPADRPTPGANAEDRVPQDEIHIWNAEKVARVEKLLRGLRAGGRRAPARG